MIYITNAAVVTGTGTDYALATIVVDGGKFVSIDEQLSDGPGTILSQATVIDVKGKVVTPGIIDVHTHLGVSEVGVGREGNDVNETSDPITPQVRALDAIHPMEGGFKDALKSGITTVQVMPGSANIIGGEMVVLKTHGRIVDEMVLRNPSGMKAALGENPKSVYSAKGKVMTRMGIAALFREALMKARDDMEARKRDPVKPRDLGMENLAKVLRREIPMRIHAHRADDIATALRLAKEFDIEITIEHCTEGHLIADVVAAAGVRVSVGPTMSTRSKVELANKGWHTLVALAQAGVPVSITTDHPVVNIEYLLTAAATAVKHGLDAAVAMRAITLGAAEHLGVAHRVGSIEAGKDADFVVWSGHPLNLASVVEATYIDGELVYSA